MRNPIAYSLLLLALSPAVHAYGTGGLINPLAGGFLGLVIIMLAGFMLAEAIKKPKQAAISILGMVAALSACFGLVYIVGRHTDNDLAVIGACFLGLYAAFKVLDLTSRFESKTDGDD